MYESRAPVGALPCAVNKPADANASPRTPVLITEQQLLFATAAAMPLRPAKPSRRWTGTARYRSVPAGDVPNDQQRGSTASPALPVPR